MMKTRVKKALSKRLKITKTGKIKRMQAARSHLKRHKTKRQKMLLNLNKADRKLTRLM